MSCSKVVVLFLVLFSKGIHVSNGLPSIIKIGALFDTEDEEQEFAFYRAVNAINSHETFMTGSRLVGQVDRMEPDDSFRATQNFCALLSSGISAVFGPQSELTSMHIQSMCDALEVPHIVTRWEYQMKRHDLSVNLYPHPAMLSKAYVQLVNVWGWKDFFLVYEENEGIIRLQNFLKDAEINKWNVKIYKFPNATSYRDVFWDIKRSIDRKTKKDSEIDYKIVLDVSREHLYNVLKSAQQVGMITEKQRYLITSLDIHTIDMEDFQYSKTNLTGLRLVQEENPEFQDLLKDVNSRYENIRNRPPLKTLKTESALMYEAVKLFALALEEMDVGKNVTGFLPISCITMNKGTDGTTLINYMKNAKMNGVTGYVRFDEEGFRSTISLDILYLTNEGLQKIGSMIPGGSINITRNLSVEFEFLELENKHYKVTTIMNDPYTMLKDSSKPLDGNERYEGFSIDLMDALSKQLHFTYEMKKVADGQYGTNKDGGIWNGMIGEVMREDADMAIADLTITSKREEAVDFTMPFMSTGISILFKKPTTKVTSLFSFLSPFSGEVWIYVMGAYMAVSIILFVVGRLSPYEWSNPHPCRQDNMVEENTFSLLNSMWFTIGSLMQQGSDVAPSASSTRTIASIWYFFNLIMISSYTANLAAFLTVEKVVFPIESAEDLANQEKIKYGCLGGGSTRKFFESSNIPTFAKMGKFMNKHGNEVLMKTNKEGKAKVAEGNYAYLMEATSIEYIVERECNLTQIGGLLDTKGYGIAVKKGNSKLSAWLSGGILKLQEEGLMHSMKERWWKQKKGGGKCVESKSSSAVNELGLGNVGGVFVVMLFGLSLSAMVAVLEFFWHSRKIDKSRKEPLMKMLIKELKFAASCGSSSKPAPKIHDRRSEKDSVSTIPAYNAL